LGTPNVRGWQDADGWHGDVQEVLEAYGVSEGASILVDDELLSVHLLALQSLYPEAFFAPIGDVMAELRQIKTQDEIAEIDRAAQLIDEVFEEAVLQMREGMTELDLSDVVLAGILKRNSRPSFPPLICFGANCALPHHHTGDTRLQKGDAVIVDIGCLSNHYASDITRTVSFGEPSDPLIYDIYQLVNEAHWAARKFACPGVACESVDAVARTIITEAGYGAEFLHRTGHGIGISTHEPPYIVSGNGLLLQEGMCFSVEPGVYLAGRFGVRIENIVTVTADGTRSVNADADTTLRVVGG
jgi:Xaa-Pro aminopeptidase